MRNSTLIRFLGISVVVASALGIASFFALRELNESSIGEIRRNAILFIAQTVESGPNYKEAIQSLHSRTERRFSGATFWIFSKQGEVLDSSREIRPPAEWSSLRKPLEKHDIVFQYGFLRLIPDLALVKLEKAEDNYLLIEFKRPGSMGRAIWMEIALFFFIGAVSVLVAVGMAYSYLRTKSKEAREILARLEKGDLKARFEIKRVDEIGSLMVDFNRMASEIERLVHRVQETEMARKDLLEELSHDLRTPLTSLNTSAETLCDHWDEMPRDNQREFALMIKSELGYFFNLIEDLFFIAAVGEPRYKKTTQKVDLFSLLAQEIKGREKTRESQAAAANPVNWVLECDTLVQTEASILGDPLLIQRLFKNALDNSGKYARSRVRVRIVPANHSVAVLIEDDGKGITDEAIAFFGQRRKNRFDLADSDPAASLGLGSVIMRTILELHGGSLVIQRAGAAGTQLNLVLPKDPR